MVKAVHQSRTATRLARARLLTVQGHSRREVSRRLQHEFGIHRNSALRTLQVLEAEQIAELEAKRERLLAQQMAKLNYVLQRALGEDDGPENLPAAVRALVEQNRILGLHQPLVDREHDLSGSLVLIERVRDDAGQVVDGEWERREIGPEAAPAQRWPYTLRDGMGKS